MIVTFCGHHDLSLSSAQKVELTEMIEKLIAEGTSSFLLGGYGNFDLEAAIAVRKAKETHPEIRSVLVLPYLDKEVDTGKYDETVYPPLENVPRRFAISKRNEWMVNEADALISGVTHHWGGAFKTLEYAKRKKKRILQLGK